MKSIVEKIRNTASPVGDSLIYQHVSQAVNNEVNDALHLAVYEKVGLPISIIIREQIIKEIN